jgi:hypothetical protein
MSGWIKLHRSLLAWEWYTDANTMRLFTHLLLTVNYESKNWRGIDIKRGQIITSVDKLSQQIGLSSQKIRTSLSKLKSTSDITIKTTNRNTLVGITNYELYQSKGDEETSQLTSKSTNKKQSNNNQITTTKEVKNIRSEEDKNKDLFDLFWITSSKRGDKKKAYSYFNKILNKKDSPQAFTDFLINDIKQRKESGQLGFDQMHITTYLNGERFDDEIQLGESNGPNRFTKPSKETALERMARKQKAMDAGAEASGHYETVLGQNDSIISTQVYDH